MPDVGPIGGPGFRVLFVGINPSLRSAEVGHHFARPGMALGLFFSAFARTELQAVQFLPAVLFPQILPSGLLVPRAHMPHALEVVSDALPVSYAYDALAKVTADDISAWLWLDILIVVGTILLALLLGASALKRRTA